MPLLAATMGQEYTVESLMLQGNIKRHMDNLGVLPGEKVIPISQNGSSLIVRIRDCRLAISMGVAAKIQVR